MNYDSPQFVAAIKKILGKYLQPKADRVDPKDATTEEGNKPPRDIPAISETTPPPQSYKETCHCRPDQTPLWKKLLETAAVFVGFAVAIIYHGQLTVMSGQLTEMQDSGRQTDQLICLYRQQLAELHKQASDTHELASQAKTQAGAALAANIQTREIFLAENRPWLSFEALGLPDAKGRVTVLMKNTGKTPVTHATDVDARTRVITGKKEIDAFWEQWKKEVLPVRPNPTEVISPNASGQTMSTPDGAYVPTGTNSDQVLIVYGRVDYSGAYSKGEHYWTEFCFAYITKIPTASPWSQCIDHNVMH